jgi:phosphate uptake regulator
MLSLSRRMLDLVLETLLSGKSLEEVRDEVFTMDRRINSLEQEIRRRVAEKLTAVPEENVASCLILFSVVKDAERCGDYAKNTYKVFVEAKGFAENGLSGTLKELWGSVSASITRAADVFLSDDEAGASLFLREAHELAKLCDTHVSKLVVGPEPPHAAEYALLFRFLKRITCHLVNIVSSVVMPLDKLDFFDEERRFRAAAEAVKSTQKP